MHLSHLYHPFFLHPSHLPVTMLHSTASVSHVTDDVPRPRISILLDKWPSYTQPQYPNFSVSSEREREMNSGLSSTTGESFLRQLSGRERRNSSKRWFKKADSAHYQKSLNETEELNKAWNTGGGGVVMRKRVIMVVVDESRCAKDAMIWALTHVANKGDLLTLLHIIPPQSNAPTKITGPYSSSPTNVANSLASLCNARRPEVNVEVLVVEGPRLATVTSQVKKLGASLLILGQKKRSPISWLFKCRNDDIVEQCVSNAECPTMAVRKQSRDVGGYLISTRWQKNFWLLA